MSEISFCRTPTNSIMYMHLISDNQQFDIDYQMHDRFEIYFIISGTVDFFVDRSIYIMEYGDILIVNNHEIHKPLLKSKGDYERIIIEFDPSILSPFCISDFNLLRCFTQKPNGKQNRISLKSGQLIEVKNLFTNFEALESKPKEGADLLKLTYLVELLVFLNQAFAISSKNEMRMKIPQKIIPILDYIDNNLEDSLTLKEIASRFYIDKYYLSRLFMKITGINIHDYILSKRIFKAKELLRDGRSILDTCQMSGFSNYSTFVRAFKNLVGILPKEYQKSSPQS
jgi:AraC-like DNA-binding protein